MNERLTARSPKNGYAYLVKVKSDKQSLEGSYNTLLCVKDAFEALATYEETGFSPEEISALAKAKAENRLVILPSKSEEIIRIVELALHIKLYDWQKAYITGAADYVAPGRRSGMTLAYMVKLCVSEGEPIDLTKRREAERYADGFHGHHYIDWFKHELWDVYRKLERVGGLRLRTIIFTNRK